MGTVSPSQSNAGDTIEAADINTPINQLAAVINGGIDTANITDGGIATADLADGAVGGSKLATSAITLGYAQITSNFSTTSATPVQVTSLTSTVTIPSGGRRIKITAFTGQLSNTAGNNTGELSIWDGTVGSGTRLQFGDITAGGAGNTGSPCIIIAVVTPAAGSKTYNVGALATAGTTTVAAVATGPAFILVEAI